MFKRIDHVEIAPSDLVSNAARVAARYLQASQSPRVLGPGGSTRRVIVIQ